jgi:hypothetical protein
MAAVDGGSGGAGLRHDYREVTYTTPQTARPMIFVERSIGRR